MSDLLPKKKKKKFHFKSWKTGFKCNISFVSSYLISICSQLGSQSNFSFKILYQWFPIFLLSDLWVWVFCPRAPQNSCQNSSVTFSESWTNEANKVEIPLNWIVWRETSEFWSPFWCIQVSLFSLLLLYSCHTEDPLVWQLIHLSNHVQKIWIFLKNPLLLLVFCPNGERDCYKYTPLCMLVQKFYLN